MNEKAGRPGNASPGEGLPGADLSGLPERGLAVVGFSGGADSTALAHWLLHTIGPDRIVLAHVNHMLRGREADRDEAFAREFAQRHGLRFAVFRADVRALAGERRMGLEECGRAVRYEYLLSLAPGDGDRVLTAHNADDNAETILLNLCRGAGLTGLCGIPAARGKLLRPLLGVGREEIEAYCAARGLAFVTDSSNLSDEYARNRIRHGVMPVLRELNPRFVQAAGQASRLLSLDRDFILEQAEDLLERAEGPYGLSAGILRAAPPSPRAAALKLWLERAGCGRLEKKHLDAARDLLFRGGVASLPGGVRAGCSQGTFWARREGEAAAFALPVGLGETPLPNGKVLVLEEKRVSCAENGSKIHNSFFKNAIDCAIITGNLIARTRREGDRFSPAGRHVAKTLKQLFQEQRVPAARRGEMVLLECGGELVFCEGAGVSERFRAAGGTEKVLMVQVRNGEAEGK